LSNPDKLNHPKVAPMMFHLLVSLDFHYMSEWKQMRRFIEP
jgi:hypothetical protein